MSRRPRELVHDGSYHVTARGNNRQSVFVSDHDRGAFLRDLDRVSAQRSWRVFAYCLMGNYVHLGLTTPHADLDAGMRGLELRRFDGHLMIRGVSPLKGVHDGKNEATVSAGVSVGGSQACPVG